MYTAQCISSPAGHTAAASEIAISRTGTHIVLIVDREYRASATERPIALPP